MNIYNAAGRVERKSFSITPLIIDYRSSTFLIVAIESTRFTTQIKTDVRDVRDLFHLFLVRFREGSRKSVPMAGSIVWMIGKDPTGLSKFAPLITGHIGFGTSNGQLKRPTTKWMDRRASCRNREGRSSGKVSVLAFLKSGTTVLHIY